MHQERHGDERLRSNLCRGRVSPPPERAGSKGSVTTPAQPEMYRVAFHLVSIVLGLALAANLPIDFQHNATTRSDLFL
jgi:hypothetical protein